MNTVVPLTPLKAIRAKCLDCSGGNGKEVRECRIISCSLHPYRIGKRPATVARHAEKKKRARSPHAEK